MKNHSARPVAENPVAHGTAAVPEAISSAATRTDPLASRICSSTPESLEAKLLKSVAICASSSSPCASIRRARSPSPEPMSCMASRTCVRRRRRRAKMAASANPAANTTTMPVAMDTCSMVVMAANASALSSAIASIQGVPSTGATASSMARPCRSMALNPVLRAICASADADSCADSSVAGLRASLTSGWAMMLPSLPTKNA